MSIRKSWLLALAFGGLLTAIACTADDDSPGSVADKVGGAPAAAAAAVSPAVIEKGRALYKANCSACHGESGKGDGPGAGVLKPKPRDHTDGAYMKTLTDKDIANVVQMGGAMKGMPMMPSSPQIRGADLDALIAYVRSLSVK